MAKVISFEKLMVLSAAGLGEREMAELHHAPQIHSASESFVQSVSHRAVRGGRRSL